MIEWNAANGSSGSGCRHGCSMPSTYARHSSPQVESCSAREVVSGRVLLIRVLAAHDGDAVRGGVGRHMGEAREQLALRPQLVAQVAGRRLGVVRGLGTRLAGNHDHVDVADRGLLRGGRLGIRGRLRLGGRLGRGCRRGGRCRDGSRGGCRRRRRRRHRSLRGREARRSGRRRPSPRVLGRRRRDDDDLAGRCCERARGSGREGRPDQRAAEQDPQAARAQRARAPRVAPSGRGRRRRGGRLRHLRRRAQQRHGVETPLSDPLAAVEAIALVRRQRRLAAGTRCHNPVVADGVPHRLS